MTERNDMGELPQGDLPEPDRRVQQTGAATQGASADGPALDTDVPRATRGWVMLSRPAVGEATYTADSKGVRLVAQRPPYSPASVDGYGLGRLPAVDPHDAAYTMAAALRLAGVDERSVVVPTSRMWLAGDVLDQGSTPQCVAYAWAGFLAASPTRTRVPNLAPLADQPGLPFVPGLYNAAKQVDEWPGENYDGTSVRAGAKVLKRLGRLSEYLWAHDANTLRTYVLARGPAVIGVNWYNDMFDADPTGHDPLNVSGGLAGGHALLVLGYSRDRAAFRLLNSWGLSWGYHGRAWLTFSDMQQLLRDEDGEACSATECIPTAG